MVISRRAPKNPFLIARVVNRLDLLPNLGGAVRNIAGQVAGGKILQPRPYRPPYPIRAHKPLAVPFGRFLSLGASCRGGKNLYRIQKGMVNGFIRLGIRAGDAEIAVSVMGGVYHRADIIQPLGHLPVVLAYCLSILAAVDHRPKHVG